MQVPGMAAQTVLGKEDVMTGVSLMFFTQGLGGSIWISAAQVLFNNSLAKGLRQIDGVDIQLILQSGTTELGKIVPAEFLGRVFDTYNYALIQTFKVALGCACVSILAGLAMEWRSLKGLKQGGDIGKKGDEEKGEKEVRERGLSFEELGKEGK